MSGAAHEVHPDSYYQDVSERAVEEAIAEAQERCMSPEETRFWIRRNYPFEDGRRGGKQYKIWNTIVLRAEERLGLPQQHRTRVANPETTPKGNERKATKKKANFVKDCTLTVDQFDSLDSLKAAWPKPTTAAEASRFLRAMTEWIVKHRPDHDLHRCVLKGMDTDEQREKYEGTAEITSYDTAEREPKLIKLAQKMYAKFIELVAQKY